MTADSLEAKAHEMLGQLGPAKLAAVVQLLEVMIGDDEELSDDDRRAVASSREYFRQGGVGLSMEQIADCGFTMDQIAESSKNA